MRIALFHNLPSGGAKRTLSEATKRLAAAHHIDVYSLSSANHDFADLRPYVASHQVFEFQPRPLFDSPFGRLNQAVRLADLLRLRSVSRVVAGQIERNDYDVILAHPCQFAKSPTILNYSNGTPTVYYCHEPLRALYEDMPARPYDDNASARRQFLNQIDPLLALYHRTLKNVDRRNTRRAGTVLVNSNFMREAVSNIYHVNAQVSYHGIDTDCFRPLALEKRPMVLSVGSLTPLKGFDFLIQALAKIPADQRPVLAIASNFQNPPERAYLQQLAADLSVDLELLGNVSDEDLVKLYNQAKVVLYAPVREPFGLVPLEAMACGTPVVAVNEGGIQETVVDGYNGLLSERDPAQFATAVQKLLANPGLSVEFGRNGQQYVGQNWTWDQAVTRLEHYLIGASQRKYTNQTLRAISVS